MFDSGPGADFVSAMLMLGLLINVVLATITFLESRQHSRWTLVWVLLVLVLPFAGFALWRASSNPGADEAHVEFRQFMNGGKR